MKPPHQVREVITSSTPWNAPKDYNKITFNIWVIAGGGGGAGNYYSGGTLDSGQAGGPGGNAQAHTVTLTQSSYYITVGAAGLGGAGIPTLPVGGWGQHLGTNGGNSSFGSLITATGGTGGNTTGGGDPATVPPPAQAGSSGGDVSYPSTSYPGYGLGGVGGQYAVNSPGANGQPGAVIIEYMTIDPTK